MISEPSASIFKGNSTLAMVSEEPDLPMKSMYYHDKPRFGQDNSQFYMSKMSREKLSRKFLHKKIDNLVNQSPRGSGSPLALRDDFSDSLAQSLISP